MDISYIHTRKRKDFGQPCSFTEVGPHLLVNIEPDPALKAHFYVVPKVDKEVDNTVKMCAHEVNTDSHPTQNQGMNHKEGGWPAGIDTEDDDSKARFRKKTEKNKNYTNAVENLGALVENLIMENNSIDVYEEYFADERVKTKHETTFQTVGVVCDPNDTPRTVADLSWSNDSSKVAGAYSIDGIRGKISDIGVDSYVWDAANNASPYCVLKTDSCLSCVEFSPTDMNLLLGGCISGQIALWDARVGGHAQKLSEIKEGHTQKVTAVKWLMTNSQMDFFSASTDGRIMSWDARNLSKPTENILLSPEAKGIPNLERQYTVSCAEYSQVCPDNFIIGTEQGQVLSFSRMLSSESGTHYSRYDCRCGPILRLRKNNFFPQLFASCDPWATKIWVEKNTESPVLNLMSQDGFCTDFTWSPTRASVLYIAKTTGVVELWDILGQHFQPRTRLKFEKGPLYSVSVNKSGDQLACGSGSGKVHLMLVPEQYKSSSDIELSLIATSVGSEEDPLEQVRSKVPSKTEDNDKIEEEEKKQKTSFEKLFKAAKPKEKEIVTIKTTKEETIIKK